MLSIKRLIVLITLFFVVQSSYSQLGFSHEIGAIVGPVEFRSDFGQRNDERTN